MVNVLVYGFYNKGNVGDDLFISSFKEIFPEFNFTFTNKITLSQLKDASAVFFGGGSFVYAEPIIENGALDILKTKKIFYIGIGVEKIIHPTHIELMKLSKLIATRSFESIDLLKELNSDSFYIPDIVYSLKSKANISNKNKKSVLIIPNIVVVPSNSDPHWKHAAWEYFKSEFSQFLDWLVSEKYNISFLHMCKNNVADDSWASIEIINKLSNRKASYLLPYESDFTKLTSIISKYDIVITQRYHGIILSELSESFCISIHHHDKLKNHHTNQKNISYYEMSKNKLIELFLADFSPILAIESDIFNNLRDKVLQHLIY